MKGHIGTFLLIIFSIFLAFSVFADSNVRDIRKDETILQPRIGTGPMFRGAGLGMMHGRMGILPRIMEFEDKLKLSGDQKAKIREMMVSHRKDMISKNAEIEIAEVELYELMQKDNPDMNAVKEKIQKIANLKADQQFSAFKLSMDVKNVLTEEQWKEFKEQVIDKRPMMRNMEGRAEGRRFGQPGRKMRQK